MTDREFLGPQRICRICKKQFHMTDGWVYRKKHNDTVLVFCSWKCLRAYENSHKKVTPSELRQMVAQAVRDGLTTHEICTLLGCSTSVVAYWRHKVAEERGEENGEKDSCIDPSAGAGDGQRGGGNGLDIVPAEQQG